MAYVDILDPHRFALAVDQEPDATTTRRLVLPAFKRNAPRLTDGELAAQRVVPVSAPPRIGGEEIVGARCGLRLPRLPLAGVGTAPPSR
jgi:hypothetical protein